MFSKIFSIATLASFALAQSTMTSPSSPAGSVAVHVIKAMNGASGPVFEPNSIQAAVGDLVQFQFYPNNHSVVQASFADPCLPIEQSASGNGTVGFFSGFMPVSSSSNVMPTFTIQVNSTNPIWFYCSQGDHCQDGMVGVINDNAQKPLSDFVARAAKASANVSPSQSEAGYGAAQSSGSPTTMQTSTMSGSSTASSTGAVATGAAPKSVAMAGSSIALVFGALIASVFLL